LTRRDLAWAAVTAAVTLALFVLTLRPDVGGIRCGSIPRRIALGQGKIFPTAAAIDSLRGVTPGGVL